MKSKPGTARGYFAIGIEGGSKAVNLGNLLRSAHAFGASFVTSASWIAPRTTDTFLPLRSSKVLIGLLSVVMITLSWNAYGIEYQICSARCGVMVSVAITRSALPVTTNGIRFWLVTAARRVRGTGVPHSTMLIHTSVSTVVHESFERPLEAFRKRTAGWLDAADGELLKELRRLWEAEIARNLALDAAYR